MYTCTCIYFASHHYSKIRIQQHLVAAPHTCLPGAARGIALSNAGRRIADLGIHTLWQGDFAMLLTSSRVGVASFYRFDGDGETILCEACLKPHFCHHIRRPQQRARNCHSCNRAHSADVGDMWLEERGWVSRRQYVYWCVAKNTIVDATQLARCMRMLPYLESIGCRPLRMPCTEVRADGQARPQGYKGHGTKQKGKQGRKKR